MTTNNRLYEGMFLFDANVAARRWPQLESRVNEIFEKNGASVEYAERWPDQRLAYEVEGARKGTYYLTYFNADPESVSSLRRDAELTEDVLRILIVQDETVVDEMKHRKDLAARRSSRESAAAASAEESAAKAAESSESADDSTEAAAEATPATEEAAATEVEAVSTEEVSDSTSSTDAESKD